MSTKKMIIMTTITIADLIPHGCGDMAIAGTVRITDIPHGIHSGILPHYGTMAITALTTEIASV